MAHRFTVRKATNPLRAIILCSVIEMDSHARGDKKKNGVSRPICNVPGATLTFLSGGHRRNGPRLLLIEELHHTKEPDHLQ